MHLIAYTLDTILSYPQHVSSKNNPFKTVSPIAHSKPVKKNKTLLHQLDHSSPSSCFCLEMEAINWPINMSTEDGITIWSWGWGIGGIESRKGEAGNELSFVSKEKILEYSFWNEINISFGLFLG